MPLPEVQFHYYKYAPRDFQEEGIRCRIRQGVGGPSYLEPEAEVEGHLHTDAENPPPVKGEQYFMEFGDQSWLVKLTHIDREPGRMIQDDPIYTGHEVGGICVKRESD